MSIHYTYLAIYSIIINSTIQLIIIIHYDRPHVKKKLTFIVAHEKM